MVDRERLLRLVPEAAWTQQVVEMARKTGWLLHHSRPAWIRSGRMVTALSGAPGLPDLIMAKPPRLIVAELKRQHGGVLSIHQERWLEAFRGVPGIEVYVWRPGDAAQVWETLQRAA
jgi:hypothetical protein